jgi:hypothetical protein
MEGQFEIETVCLYREPCNCGDHIRHNNGGNYHQTVNLITVTNGEAWCVVLEETNTRESFPGDTFETLCANNQSFYLCQRGHKAKADIDLMSFRKGEAEILAQS